VFAAQSYAVCAEVIQTVPRLDDGGLDVGKRQGR
jgi:hypothetical protein